jgi:hypothetical protein
MIFPGSLHGSFRKKAGMALVVCLSLIVLITAAVLAFFARATANRAVEASRANRIEAEQLAKTAEDYITSGFLREIATNSTATTSSGVVIYQPTTNTFAVPQRPLPDTLASDPNFANLIRRSINQTTNGIGETNASAHSTAAASRNGRSVGTSRWNAPMLLSDTGFTDTNQLPNWIYVNSDGSVTSTPTTNSTGRFAYNVYDTGGLLDANVAGYPSGISGTNLATLKGSLAGADLSVIPGMTDAFIQWRNTNSAGSASSYVTAVTNAATNGFLRAALGDNRITSRQDLIKLAKNGTMGITALPFLTHFSRTVNAPSYSPDPGRPKVGGFDDAFNPSLVNERQSNGQPLLQKRFPLSRLSLITSTSTADSTSDIYKYFGLQRGSASSPWVYDHGAANRILKLSEVAAVGRDPDFFELLQAVTVFGSLGKTVTNTRANVSASDANTYYQTLEVGANIIDQYDPDSFPTRISFNSGEEFYGEENLPYLTRVFGTPYRFSTPATSPNAGVWYQPEIWNPHAQAGTPPSAPSQFRFIAEGSAYAMFRNSAYSPASTALSPITNFPSPAANTGGIRFSNAFPEPALLSPANATASGADEVNDAGVHFFGIHVGTASARDQRLDPTAPNEYWWANAFSSPTVTFHLQYLDLDGTTWITYHRMRSITHIGSTKNNAGDAFRSYVNGVALSRSDPRSDRFGASITTIGGGYLPGVSLRPNASMGYYSYVSFQPSTGWTFNGPQPQLPSTYLGTLSDNKDTSETHYTDPDGVLRRADGAYTTGALPNGYPLNAGNLPSRPIILNRAFRSVAELAYASRGLPWKTLDFFTTESGDAALLDVFCLNESPAIGAGKLDLNTRQQPVIKAVLVGAIKSELSGSTNSIAEADALATSLINLTTGTTTGPLINRSDLVRKWAQDLAYTDPADTIIKSHREAAIRALADVGTTRTWNLMIDVIAQIGRYPTDPANPGQFLVEGESRCWLHVAIDRYTGKVIAQSLEPVYE